MSQPAPSREDLLARRPRTHRVFTGAEMERLHALYYDKTAPLTRVAGAFSVPVSTLLRWISEMDWPRRRAMNVEVAPPEPPAPPDEPPPQPGAGTRSAPRVTPFDLDFVRADILEAARRELAALQGERGPFCVADHDRRARVLALLTRAIDRTSTCPLRRARSRRPAPCCAPGHASKTT